LVECHQLVSILRERRLRTVFWVRSVGGSHFEERGFRRPVHKYDHVGRPALCHEVLVNAGDCLSSRAIRCRCAVNATARKNGGNALAIYSSALLLVETSSPSPSHRGKGKGESVTMAFNRQRSIRSSMLLALRAVLDHRSLGLLALGLVHLRAFAGYAAVYLVLSMAMGRLPEMPNKP